MRFVHARFLFIAALCLMSHGAAASTVVIDNLGEPEAGLTYGPFVGEAFVDGPTNTCP